MMSQPLDTTTVVQERLADNEIARVITALGSAEFKAGAKPSLTPDQSFRPRSLMEIAASAQRQAESDKPHVTTGDEAKKKHKVNSQTETGEFNADGVVTDQTFEETTAAQQGEVAFPIADTQANDDKIGSEDEMVELNEGGVDTLKTTGESDGLVKQQAYDSGYADGEEAGRLSALSQMKAETETRIRAELQEKLHAFDSALSALLSYDNDQIKSFSDEIQTLVLELTTQRTGMAIAELPEAFVGKIKALAEQIGRRLSDTEIHLNADDMAQIKPLMDEQGSTYRFVSDPTMVHGDVKLVVGGVEIENRIGVIAKELSPRDQKISTEKKEHSDEVPTGIDLTTAPIRDDLTETGDQSDEESPGIVLTTVPNRDDLTESGDQSDEESPGIVLTTVPNRDDLTQSGDQSDEESPGIVLTTVPNRDDLTQSGDQSDEESPGIVLTTVPNRDDLTGSGEQSDEESPGIVLTTVPNRDDLTGSGEQSDEGSPGIVLTTVPNREDPNDP